MFAMPSDAKLKLVLDDEENANYTYNIEHRDALEKLFFYAVKYGPVPGIAEDIAKAEEMYEISFSALLKTGKQPTELAGDVIRQLQLNGRLPVLRNTQRFTYPKIEDYKDDMFNTPVAQRSTASPTSPKPKETFTPISAATMSFMDPLSGPSEPSGTSEQELADVEKRKKEQMAKQAKALADKENEAKQRKMIREQFEKDRAERLRQEEERRNQRSAETQQISPNSATNPLAGTSGLHVPSVGPASSSTSPVMSPRQKLAQESKPQAEPVERHGHWAAPSSTPRQVERARFTMPPETMLRYVELLAKLESEWKRTNHVLQAAEKLREIQGGVTELDDKVEEWERYAAALRKDIENVKNILRGELVEDMTEPTEPTEPAGFTLRGESIELDIEEVTIEARALVLVNGEPKWRVKVHLLEGPPVVVAINPTHTVQDIIHHLASLCSFTNRYHLEVSGKPGELDAESTAEASGLNMTTLRLIRK